MDGDLILKLAESHEALITIEEGAVGGFGSHVAQFLAEAGLFDKGLPFRSMVLPDIFIDQASPRDMYDVAGLNAGDIEAKVLEVLGVAQIHAARGPDTVQDLLIFQRRSAARSEASPSRYEGYFRHTPSSFLIRSFRTRLDSA